MAKGLLAALPSTIAKALDGGQERSSLKPTDVEIQVFDSHPLDVNPEGFDLRIMIFANEFPERDANLAERVEIIRKVVDELTPAGIKFYVWVLTAHGEFRTGVW